MRIPEIPDEIMELLNKFRAGGLTNLDSRERTLLESGIDLVKYQREQEDMDGRAHGSESSPAGESSGTSD